MKNQFKTVIIAAAMIPCSALAERQLSKSEVVDIFTDVTFDGVYLPKDKHFVAYDAPDGTLHILRPNGKRDKGRRWYVKEPLIKYVSALRESVGRQCKASCAGNGPALSKRDNAAVAPDRPRPKGLSGEPTAFVASP